MNIDELVERNPFETKVFIHSVSFAYIFFLRFSPYLIGIVFGTVCIHFYVFGQCLYRKMKLTNSKQTMRLSWRRVFPTIFTSCTLLMCILNVQAIDIDRICPRMLHKVFNGYAPIGELMTQLHTKFIQMNFEV